MSAANRASFVAEKSAASSDLRQNNDRKAELIPTAFGNLTRTEIRDWERMLGRRLLRLPSHPSEIKNH